MKVQADIQALKKHLEELCKIPYAAKEPTQAAFFISFSPEQMVIFVRDDLVAIKKIIPVDEKMKVEGSGRFVVNAYIFNELIQSFESDVEIDFPEQKTLYLRSGQSKNQINLVSEEFWKVFPDKQEGASIKIASHEVIAINNQVAFAASKQDGREIHRGINFRCENTTLKAMATDNQRIAHKKLELTTNQKVDVTIPARAFSELCRQITIENDTKELTVTFGSDTVHIELSPNKFFVSSLLQGSFPESDAHLQTKTTGGFVCAKSQILKALNRASIIFDKNTLPSTKIQTENKQVLIATNKDVSSGSTEERIEAEVVGELQTCTLQVKFLTQAIHSIDSAKIQFRFAADSGPIFVSAPDDQKLVHLILPFWEY